MPESTTEREAHFRQLELDHERTRAAIIRTATAAKSVPSKEALASIEKLEIKDLGDDTCKPPLLHPAGRIFCSFIDTLRHRDF